MSARHGTPAGYKYDGCRCEPCIEAKRRYQRRSTKMLRQGVRRYIAADEVRDHILELRAAGITYEQIHAATGYAQSGLVEIVKGRYRRIHIRNAQSILRLTPTRAAAAHHMVDATGATRRLRALNALGWTNRDALRAAGINGDDLHRLEAVLSGLRKGRNHTVNRDTADIVAVAYARLSMRLPDHMDHNRSKTRNIAEANGWPPPLAWDDATIDNPQARPASGARRAA